MGRVAMLGRNVRGPEVVRVTRQDDGRGKPRGCPEPVPVTGQDRADKIDRVARANKRRARRERQDRNRERGNRKGVPANLEARVFAVWCKPGDSKIVAWRTGRMVLGAYTWAFRLHVWVTLAGGLVPREDREAYEALRGSLATLADEIRAFPVGLCFDGVSLAKRLDRIMAHETRKVLRELDRAVRGDPERPDKSGQVRIRRRVAGGGFRDEIVRASRVGKLHVPKLKGNVTHNTRREDRPCGVVYHSRPLSRSERAGLARAWRAMPAPEPRPAREIPDDPDGRYTRDPIRGPVTGSFG